MKENESKRETNQNKTKRVRVKSSCGSQSTERTFFRFPKNIRRIFSFFSSPKITLLYVHSSYIQ